MAGKDEITTQATQHICGFFASAADVCPVGSILYRRGGADPWRQFDRELFAAEHTLGCEPVEDSGIVVRVGPELDFEIVVSGEFPRDGIRGDLDAAVAAGLLGGIEFVSTTTSTPAEEAVPEPVTVDGAEIVDIAEAPVVDD